MQGSLWHRCLRQLESEVPEQQFNTWVRPLQAVEREDALLLLAPNRFVVSWIEQNLFGRIEQLVGGSGGEPAPRVVLEVGSRSVEAPAPAVPNPAFSAAKPREPQLIGSRINPEFTFASFVEGKSNQLARAAAVQVGENPGRAALAIDAIGIDDGRIDRRAFDDRTFGREVSLREADGAGQPFLASSTALRAASIIVGWEMSRSDSCSVRIARP